MIWPSFLNLQPIWFPKAHTDLECMISVPLSNTLGPISRRHLDSCWQVTIKMISDLSSCSLGRFVDIHILILATHELILLRQESLDTSDELMNDAYSWMSLAYKWKSWLCCLHVSSRGVVNKVNRSTLPWGYTHQ